MRVTGQSVSDIPGQKPPQTHAPKADQSAVQTATQSVSSAGAAVVLGGATRAASKDSVGSEAVVDKAKVAKAKADIQNGTFVVNHEAIADSLLSQSQDFLKTTSK